MLNFAATDHDVYCALSDMSRPSNFALSLMEQIERGRQLSVKQREAAIKMVNRYAEAESVDLSPIEGMFEAAVASGYKRPRYRAEGVVLTRAPDHGANPGAIYVKSVDGDYLGKVLDGKLYGGGIDALRKIAADPAGSAIAYGRRTGQCACCGRELTDPVSIERGIGPICADRWGF